MISWIRVRTLMKNYMRVEPVPDSTWSRTVRRSFSGSSSASRSSSRESRESRSNSRFDFEHWDDDEPVGVPKGCFAVYVGPEMQRYVIHTTFLSNQVFRELLQKSEEEYGFESEGGLRLACEAVVFEKLLWQLESERY